MPGQLDFEDVTYVDVTSLTPFSTIDIHTLFTEQGDCKDTQSKRSHPEGGGKQKEKLSGDINQRGVDVVTDGEISMSTDFGKANRSTRLWLGTSILFWKGTSCHVEVGPGTKAETSEAKSPTGLGSRDANDDTHLEPQAKILAASGNARTRRTLIRSSIV